MAPLPPSTARATTHEGGHRRGAGVGGAAASRGQRSETAATTVVDAEAKIVVVAETRGEFMDIDKVHHPFVLFIPFSPGFLLS